MSLRVHKLEMRSMINQSNLGQKASRQSIANIGDTREWGTSRTKEMLVVTLPNVSALWEKLTHTTQISPSMESWKIMKWESTYLSRETTVESIAFYLYYFLLHHSKRSSQGSGALKMKIFPVISIKVSILSRKVFSSTISKSEKDTQPWNFEASACLWTVNLPNL